MFLVGVRIELTAKWTVTDPSSSHVSVHGIVASDHFKTCTCIGVLVPGAKERQRGKNLHSVVHRPLGLLRKGSSQTSKISVYSHLSGYLGSISSSTQPVSQMGGLEGAKARN